MASNAAALYAVKTHQVDLVRAIVNDHLGQLANELYSRGVIRYTAYQQALPTTWKTAEKKRRATSLVTEVEQMVECSPAVLSAFVDAVKSFRLVHAVALKIKQKYEEFLRKQALPTSGEEIQESKDEKKDISTKTMAVSYEMMQTDFEALFQRIETTIKKNVPLADMKNALLQADFDLGETVKTAVTIEEVMACVRCKCCFTNLVLLQALIDAFELEDVQHDLAIFTAKTINYYQQTHAKDFTKVHLKEYEGNNEIKVTFIMKWPEEKTLKDFHNLLQAAFENASQFLTLRMVDCCGMHKFVCTSPPSVSESLKKMFIEKESFFRQQGVAAMKIGDNVILLAPQSSVSRIEEEPERISELEKRLAQYQEELSTTREKLACQKKISKTKMAEIEILKKENKQLKSELSAVLRDRDELISILNEREAISLAIFHPTCFCKDQEARVKMVAMNSKGERVEHGGEKIRCCFTKRGEEHSGREEFAHDGDDGTYAYSVVPHDEGEYELSLTVCGQLVQNSPMLVHVGVRDYTTFRNPMHIITGSNTPTGPTSWTTVSPHYIAFSGSGEMFVTSCVDHCVYVYDNSGTKKATIGRKGTGDLEFHSPCGIAIAGDTVYVADWRNSRIQSFSTSGRFLSKFGSYGSGEGQLRYPVGICIGMDSMLYVADQSNNRVQVFNTDGTFSHSILGNSSSDVGFFAYPQGVACDPHGNIHVVGNWSNNITIFEPEGKFVTSYEVESPTGLAIDKAGFSLITTSSQPGTLCIFDPNRLMIHSVQGFCSPCGISIAPDNSVWVADGNSNDHLLLQY